MVMPRSFSSSLVSVYRVSPALAPAMIPAFETSESVSVDLPWSTGMMRQYVSVEVRGAKACTMGDDTHVTDICGLIHEGPNLI